MQVIQQTRDEKIAMYMKLTKRELAEMLANANDILGSQIYHMTTRSEPATTAPPYQTTCNQTIVAS